ncbi:MAG TPA: hypothetical protein VM260_25530, partial [Pirellula sp.]|nr:hypothetical protein [Pirellula sp.]
MTERDSILVIGRGKSNSVSASKKAKAETTTPATTPAKKKREKPKKPHKDFPLFPHDSGQWAKKVRGKLYYFGSDSKAAMEKWLREKDDLLAGRTPRAYDPNALTIKRLCDLFLESREDKIATGEITKCHFDDLKKAAIVLADNFGRGAAVEQLRPDDFGKLRSKLGKGVGLKTLSGRMARTRSIFNYASKNGLLELNMNKLWGTEFDKPGRAAMSKQSDIEQLFTRDEILTLLEHASEQVKAMILIGINCGYGNTDCAMIERSDIVGEWITRKRQKTGKRRRTHLWPETREAIANALAAKPACKDESDSNKLFITKYGNNWIPTSRANPVSQEFGKVARAAKIAGKGKSFYTL